jgi:hypothetical protein
VSVSIEQLVLEHLLASDDVEAIVDDRGSLLILPQDSELPALRVQLIDEIERVTLAGDLTNLFRARVQVDVWTSADAAENPYASARAAGQTIRNRLVLKSAGGQRFEGGGSPPTLAVSSVQTLDKDIDYDPDERRLVRMRQDFGLLFTALVA